MNIYEAAKKALEEGKCIRERPYKRKDKAREWHHRNNNEIRWLPSGEGMAANG